ncbi:choice-of-anchor Q domain-containing protein [Luteolibacter soli]|uniref:Choice-of-anchor Q domain-containing protein n=1 Tax=Luteolibacter soli TaxID=3135280 RepID=A0ABU9B0N4_9BACT
MFRSLPIAVAAFSLLGGSMQRLAAQTPDVKATLTDTTPAATKKNPGDAINYRVTVTNAATATGNANNPIVSLPTPAGTTIVAGSVNMSPLVFDESYNTLPNTQLVIDSSHGVAWNDVDDKGSLTVVNATRLDGTGTTNANPGTLVVAGNGSFTYTPGVGATGSERFQYYLRDSDNVLSVSPGIVTFSLTGPRIWFVQAGAAAGGNGQSQSPFNTPAAASTAATGTDMIYVLGSASPLNGQSTLEDGQELRGQGVELSVATGHPSFPASPPLVIFPATTAPVLTNTGGDIVSLAAGSATKTISGVNLGTRTGSAITGSGFGTLAVGSLVSTSGSGQVLGLTNGALGGTFASLSTTSAGTAIGLTTITGSLNATTVSMTGVTGDLFNINGGTVTLGLPANYAFSGTTGTGRSLNISNRGAGGNLTFNNKIINTGAGILLDNNDAATITFRSLNLTTATNTAFSAINGGTVVVTNALTDGIDNDGDGTTDEADEANIITTTTGTALNVTGTNIGAGGMTFRSISAGTAASGPANGIVLNTTGNSGGLTVTGDGGGSNNGSGGTIQRTSGAGLSFTSASNVSLGYMNIQDSADDGISGTSVTGFTMNRCNVTNNGNAVNEDGVDFGGSGTVTPNGLFGSANVTNSSFTGNYYNQFTVRNSSGTVGLAVTGCTFNGRAAENNNNDGLFLEVLSSATITANAQSSSFSANKGDHFQASASNSGNLNVTFKSNTLTGGHSSALGQGITINAATGLAFGGYTGTVNYDIDGNTINGSILSAITVNLGTSNPPALFNGFIRNNVIGTTGQTNSGSTQGYGIAWDAHGKGTHTSSVTGNTVREAFDRGMGVLINDGSPVVNLTITGNNLRPTANDPNGSREAIEFNIASTSTNVFGEVDAPTTRVNLSGNTLVGGASKNGDIRMRQRFRSRVEMPSFNNGGDPFNTANVISFLQTNNAPATATATASNDASVTTDGYFGGPVSTPGSVPLPLLFAPAETASVMPVEPQSTDTVALAEPVVQTTTEDVPAPAPRQEIEPITQAELDRMVALARERWEAAGLSGEQTAALDGLTFEVTDLPGWHLGEAGGKKVRIDRDAGGNGWFVDSTPAEDSEFTSEGGRLMAKAGSEVRSDVTGRVDLLTTVLHEMGHTIGLCDAYVGEQRNGVMYGFLTKGERRLPKKGEAAGAVPHDHETPHYLDAPLGLPVGYQNLPPGKGFRIYYQVTVNNPLTVAPISSQGTVTGGNFAPVTTDDVVNDTDAPAGPADPTVTLIERPDTTVASINRTSANPNNTTSMSWQVVFAAPVNGLTASNFSLATTGTVSGATIGAPVPASAEQPPGGYYTTWNVTVTGVAGDGSLGLNLANDTGLLHDITNKPFTGQVYTIDKTPPTVAFSSAAANPTNVSPIPVTVTFSENVTGFIAGDITPGNATVANFAGSGNIYTFDLVPAGQGAVTADIAASVAQDSATNNNTAAAQFIRNYDSVVPTVAMTSATGNPAPNAAIPVSVNFSESVTGFVAADITPGNATVANFGGTGANYTFNLVPSAPGVTATADIAAGVAQDAASNSNTAATQFSRTILDAVSIAATTATAVEGGATGLYTFTRGASSGDVTVNFQLDASSTAVAGTDFTLSSTQALTFNNASGAGTLVIPDGSLTATVTLTALTESLNAAEVAETARLNVASGTGYIPASSPGNNATVTIAANGFVVVNTNDSGAGSLRQAIANANAIAGADTITFEGSTFSDATQPDFIDLASMLPSLSQQLRIVGPGSAKLVIRRPAAAGPYSLMQLFPGANASISGLTFSGGDGGIANLGTLRLEDCVISGNSSSTYGGILNNGTLVVLNSTIANNASPSGVGGGIYSIAGSSLTVVNSTLSGNTSLNGGGAIAIVSGATVVISNSTISGNTAGGSGAGILSSGTLTVINSTITGNASTGDGGGIASSGSSSFTLKNSIVAGNTATGTGADIQTFSAGHLLVSNGANFIGSATGANGISGTDKTFASTSTTLGNLLSPLANNGGPTQTHSLPSGSPAINGGTNADLPADTLDLDGDSNTTEPIPFDQRGTGFVRAIGSVDMGAFELQKSVSIAADLASANEGNGAGTTDFTFTVTRSGGTTGPVTIDYAVTGSGGNPADAADFGGTLPSGQVTIADGSDHIAVTIPVSKDSVRESNEGFQVTLSNPTDGYVVSGTSATSTITNDDFEADLAITKTDGVTTATPGGSVTYTITASNAGPDPVVGAAVADTFPASLTATWTAVGAGGGTATASGSGNINDTVNLPVGGSVTYTVSATISPAATGTLSNTATVSTSAGVTDPTPGNNSATDTDTLNPQADLSITKTDGVTTATPGGSVTYTITASNAGPSNAVATVADTFPASLTATWTAVGAGGGTATASGSGNINDTVNLPAGGSVTYTVSATISPSATGTLSNTATVSSVVTDPTPGNNSATDTDTLTPSANLSITKTDGVTTATPGGSVTYTITASNAGPSNAVATVADTLPASLTATWTAVGAGGGTATASGSGNINDTVNLPAGGSVTYTVSATISAAATGTLSNTATVSSAVTDPVPGNNSATDSDTLTPQANLSITKTDGVTTATPGGSVTYTITASNAGPSNAVATVADTLPASLTATWTAVGAGGGTATASGSGNINDTVNLPVGGSVTYTVSATISAAATGTLSNTATVTSAVTDPTPGNNSATDTDTLTPQANLSITKTDGVTTATPGGSVTYTITASNAGPSNVTGATVADTLPASLTATWTAVGAGGGTATASGSGNINDTVNLPAGGSVTYTVTATISPAATGTLSNTATVSSAVNDPTPANNSATDTDTLTPRADLTITKTDGVTTAVPGGSVTYTITASNAGPSNVTGATVADTLPASLTGTWTAVGAGGGTATASGSGNINDTVNLPAGGSVTYTVTATISPSATGTLSNTATVSSAVTDPTPGNNSATDTDTLTPQANLSITKTDGVTTAIPGGSVTYTITASNAGPSNVTGATVADTLPASLTATWTAVGAGGGTATASGSGNINDTVNLPAGASVTYTVSATISASATGTLSNTATVSAPEGVTDPSPANNSATDSDTLTPRANLAITKTDKVTTATPGGSVTYTIVATNAGPSNATGATVADTLPASLTATWTAFGAGGGTATASGSGNINDTVNLPVGGSVTYTVTAAISPAASGTLSNTATVSAPAGVTDPTPADNSATDSDTLDAQADLSITKTDGVTTATPGGSVTYTITASNAGPSNASAVSVSDVLPASISGATWTGAGAGGGTGPANGSGNISVSNISLPAGGSFTFTVTAPISAAATGTLVNTATVSSAATDPNPANNSATDTDTLAPQANLAITKTDGVTSAIPGTQVTYTITASNSGPSNSPGSTVADTLPATITGVTWTAVGAGGGTATASGSGNINDTVNLPAGGSVTYTVTGTISSTATGTLANTATVATPAGVTDPTPGNNSATDTDTLTPQANLALTMTDAPDPVNALGNLTYTIGLTNIGPSASASPQVVLPLPAGTTFASASAPAGWSTSSPAVGATGTVTFTASSIASAGTASFTVVAKVDINIVNDSILTATSTASSATADPTPGNNTATTTTQAKSGADVELTLTDSPDPVNAGTNLTYTIGATNHGPLAADNVSINQALPAGTTFVSLNVPAAWSATTPAVGSAGTVSITRASFANAATGTFTLVVKVASNVANATVLSSTAAVSSTTVDIVPGNNSVTATTTVSTQANLAVAIVASPTTAPKGSNVTFSVGLSNQGPSDAASTVVSLPVPANMTFASASAPAGWTTTAPAVGATGTVTFSATSLATGGTADFTVVAKVNTNAPTGTVLSATVTTSSAASDPQTANNSATATAAVGTVLPTVVQPITTGIALNSQSGLFEVNVNVTNTTPNAINGFRLHVDYASYKAAYPSLRLFNASSPANAQDVYVDYPFPVAIDGAVTMKLSFYTSTRTFPSPFAPQLSVEILPSSQLPGTDGAGVQPRVVGFTNGSLLLEFPSVTGKWYRVKYSSDLVHWQDCPVPLQAGSTRMQWIDSGPPFTDVPPSQVPNRYYRVNEIAAP